jgi:hypothetical protein
MKRPGVVCVRRHVPWWRERVRNRPSRPPLAFAAIGATAFVLIFGLQVMTEDEPL